MADKYISELSETLILSGSEYIIVDNAVDTMRATISTLSSMLLESYASITTLESLLDLNEVTPEYYVTENDLEFNFNAEDPESLFVINNYISGFYINYNGHPAYFTSNYYPQAINEIGTGDNITTLSGDTLITIATSATNLTISASYPLSTSKTVIYLDDYVDILDIETGDIFTFYYEITANPGIGSNWGPTRTNNNSSLKRVPWERGISPKKEPTRPLKKPENKPKKDKIVKKNKNIIDRLAIDAKNTVKKAINDFNPYANDFDDHIANTLEGLLISGGNVNIEAMKVGVKLVFEILQGVGAISAEEYVLDQEAGGLITPLLDEVRNFVQESVGDFN